MGDPSVIQIYSEEHYCSNKARLPIRSLLRAQDVIICLCWLSTATTAVVHTKTKEEPHQRTYRNRLLIKKKKKGSGITMASVCVCVIMSVWPSLSPHAHRGQKTLINNPFLQPLCGLWGSHLSLQVCTASWWATSLAPTSGIVNSDFGLSQAGPCSLSLGFFWPPLHGHRAMLHLHTTGQGKGDKCHWEHFPPAHIC